VCTKLSKMNHGQFLFCCLDQGKTSEMGVVIV